MTGPLDPSQDPDRFPATDRGRGESLKDLLGEGAQEDDRDGWTWLLGLGMVFAFLLLITLLAHLGTH